jgi:hypothetical protein
VGSDPTVLRAAKRFRSAFGSEADINAQAEPAEFGRR